MSDLRDPFFAPNDVSLDEMEQLQTSGMGSLRRGWESGRIGAERNALGIDELAARSAGDLQRAEGLRAQNKALGRRQALYAPEVRRVEDINWEPGKALSWVAGQFGQGPASMVEPVAAATALGGVGRLAGMLPGAAGKVGRAIGTIGGPAAAFGINQRQMAGEFANNAMQDQELMARTSPQDLYRTANLVGGLAGAMDTVLPGVIGHQLTGGALRAGVKGMGPAAKTALGMLGALRAGVKGMGPAAKTALGMLGEGGTELTQGEAGRYALGYLNPNRDVSEDASNRLNEAAGGMVGAGPLVAAGAYADAGFRRMGHTAGQIGTKAGEVYDLAKEQYEGSALERGVDAAGTKAKGLFNRGKGEVVDLYEAAKDEDGKVNLGKAVDMANERVRQQAEEFLGQPLQGGKLKLDDDTRNALAFGADPSVPAPQHVLDSQDPEATQKWYAEGYSKRGQTALDILDELAANGDQTAERLAVRIAEEGFNSTAADEGVMYVQQAAAESEKAEFRSNAEAGYAIAGKLGAMGARAIGKGAVKVGKGVLKIGKDIWSAGKDELSKKNAQGEELSAYAAWRERTGRAKADMDSLDIQNAEVRTRLHNSMPAERKAQEAIAQRRAEAMGEILVAEAQALDETPAVAWTVQGLGFELADIAASWGMNGPKQEGAVGLAAGTRQMGGLTLTLDNAARALKMVYGDKAIGAVDQLRAVADAGAGPMFDYLAEQIKKVGTAAGRAEMAATRKNVANQMMQLVPADQVARMQASGGDYREKFLRAIETIANGVADPGLRKAFERELGKDTVLALTGMLNNVTPESKPKSGSMFGDSPDTGVEDDFERAAAEKNVSAGAGQAVYGFHATSTFRGGNRRIDPFAADITAKGEDKLAAEDEALQRKADGERGGNLGKKRPMLFKQGQKLFGGEDAIGKKIADLEKYLGVDQTPERMAKIMEQEGNKAGAAKARELMARGDEKAQATLKDGVKSFFVNRAGNYKVGAKSAKEVMDGLGYQPGKVLSLYRDYLRQENKGLRANKVAQAVLALSEGEKEGRTPRMSADEVARIVAEAEKYFSERFLVVAEGLSDRVPDKMNVGEVMDLVRDASKALDNIDGAVRKRLKEAGLDADKDSKEFIDARNEMISEGNFIFFTTADKVKNRDGTESYKRLPIRASQLVGWVKAQKAQYETDVPDETGKKDSFKNIDKDMQFLENLLSGINAVRESGHTKQDTPPYMFDKFGRPESFGDGIPPSLQLATTTQFQRERVRNERAVAKTWQVGPPNPMADPTSDQYQAKVGRDQDKDEGFVAEQDRGAEGVDPYQLWGDLKEVTRVAGKQVGDGRTMRAVKDESSEKRTGDDRTTETDRTPLDFFGGQEEGEAPDEFADALYRTKRGGKSVYDPLPFETVSDAARKAEDRSGPILQALRGKLGTPEQGLNQIIQRIKAAETPYTKDGPAGGIQYLYPAAAALNPGVFDAELDGGGKMEDLNDHLMMLRGQVFRVLRDGDVAPKHKVAITRLLVGEKHAAKITAANVDEAIAKRAAPDKESGLDYFDVKTQPEMKDITQKKLTVGPLVGPTKDERLYGTEYRTDGQQDMFRETADANPRFPGEYARTRKYADKFEGSVDDMNAAIERKGGQLRATKLQTIANLAERARESAKTKAAPEVAATKAPRSQGAQSGVGNKARGTYDNPIVGDLWAQDGVKVVSTNLGGIHGRGLAKQAKDKGLIGRNNIDFDSSPKTGVITLAVKGRAPETAKVPGRAFSEQVTAGNIDLLKSELRKLIRHARQNPTTNFYLPYVGLGFGEGDVSVIGPILEATAREPNIHLVAKDQDTVDRYASSFAPGVRRDGTSRGGPAVQNSKIEINAHQSTGYRARTEFNANSADMTVAVAKNFATAGERLTHSVAGDRYMKFEFGDARADGRALAQEMQRRGATSLNVAGNGIYTLAQYGMNQAQVNQHIYDMLSETHAMRPLTKIVSGGQTGVDIAGAVAARALGIPATITLPKGFVQRNAAGQDLRLSRAEIEQQIEDGAARVRRAAPKPSEAEGRDLGTIPMYYKMPAQAVRQELRAQYPNGTTTAQLMADGHRTATTRRAFGRVGDTFTVNGIKYRITALEKVDLNTAAGRAKWSQREGWDVDYVQRNLSGQVYTGALQTVFERVGETQETSGVGFKLTPRGPFTPKDQAKADRATAFIGRGSATSSTNSYANDARAAGIPVNPGKYSASDVVFVSAEGKRAGRLDPDFKEIDRAMSAGATIITDPSDSTAMKRDHNVGERAVMAHLKASGYVERAPGEWGPGDAKPGEVDLGAKGSTAASRLGIIADNVRAKTDPAITKAAGELVNLATQAWRRGTSKEEFLQDGAVRGVLAVFAARKLVGAPRAQEAIDAAMATVDQIYGVPLDRGLLNKVQAHLVETMRSQRPAMLADILADYSTSQLPAGIKAVARAVQKVAGDAAVRAVSKNVSGGSEGTYRLDNDTIEVTLGASNPLHTVLHEGVHAATISAVMKDAELHKALYSLMAHAVAHDPALQQAYGFTNVLEFLAEGLSNNGLQRRLYKVPANKTVEKYLGATIANAWDAFTALVRKALNLPAEHQSVLTQLLDLSGRAMKAAGQSPDRLTSADERARASSRTLVPQKTVERLYKQLTDLPALSEETRKLVSSQLGSDGSPHFEALLVTALIKELTSRPVPDGSITPNVLRGIAAEITPALQRVGLPNKIGAAGWSDTGARKLNAQAESEPMAGWKAGPTAKATGAPASDREMAQAQAYVKKVLGPKFKLMFEKDMSHSGEFIEAENLIKIAVGAAAGTMPTAYHEALHAFFASYLKSDPRAMEVMKALAENQTILDRITALLDGYPAAQAQLTSGEERLAYIFQFYAAGQLDLPSGKGRNWVQKLVRYFRKVLGTLRADERATDILDAFHDGKFSDPSTAQRVLAKISTPNSLSVKARRNFDGLIQGAAAAALPAQAILNDSPSRTAKRLMRTFYANPGSERDGKGGEGYLNAVKSERTRRNNAIMAALEEGGATERDMKAIVTYLQQGVDPIAEADKIPYAPHRKAVAKIRAELEDFHHYMTSKGLDIGYIQDYFPVVWNSEALAKNPTKFAKMLVENYPEQMSKAIDGTNLSPMEAAMHLTTLLIDRAVFDGKLAPGREDGVLIPFFESSENRTLDWIKPEHREPWLSKELLPTLTKYFGQGVRAAEYVERFGEKGEKLDHALKLIDQELSAEGAKMVKAGKLKDVEAGNKWAARQYRDVRMAVGAMEGTLGKNISDTHRSITSWVVVYQNIRLLPLSLFASVVDPLSIVARGGDFKLAGEVFINGMKEVFKGWREVLGTLPPNQQKNEWEQMAEFIGATESAMMAHFVSEEYSSQYMSPRAKKINDMMFKLNGMESWNRAMRVGATKGAAQFLIKHKDLPDAQHSKRWLKELGLTPEDIIVDNGKLVVDKHELATLRGISLEEADAKTRKVQFAMNRWIEGAVLTPNSAQRPAWSSDPRWSFIFHLKQFTYSFQQTILTRAWNEMKQGNLAPMGSLSLFIPAMIASDMTKGLIVGGGELPPYMQGYNAADWFGHGLERAGALGYGQLALDAVQDPASLGGPMAEQIVDAFRQPIGDTLLKALPANALYRNAFA